MVTRTRLAGWLRNRYTWAAAVLLAAATGAVVLVTSSDSEPDPADLPERIEAWMRTTLEQADPEQHHHAGHDIEAVGAGAEAMPPVVCGVRVYGYEPSGASSLDEVETVYGFHMCGVAEPQRRWDFAVKLAGPVIMDRSTEPPGIQVVEATADVMFVDRLREVFPEKYAELALTEALTEAEMADLRRRYDAAAGG